jgi:hypothetical protein
LVSFVVPMVLLALLLTVKPAHAVTIVVGPPPPVSEEQELEEDEEAEEDCYEEAEDEFEEEECEEAEEEEEEETDLYPPDECVLRTARARVFAYTSRDRVRLVIHYTSLTPASVTVNYRLKGSKGPLQLGRVGRHFSRSGLFRLTTTLSHSQMAKVRAARLFDVELNIPGEPHYCQRYYSRHLTIKRTTHSQVVWFQSDSIFGTKR